MRRIRVRGGHFKFRALRLDTGNFSWGSEATTRKTRVLDVTYNASNNELVRTQTLVKGAIVQVDATPFRQWYIQHYGGELGKAKKAAAVAGGGATPAAAEEENKAGSAHVVRKLASRSAARAPLDPELEKQFGTGRLYAVIASRPGQCGRVDGYVLEGKELAFYLKSARRAAPRPSPAGAHARALSLPPAEMAKKKGGASAQQ